MYTNLYHYYPRHKTSIWLGFLLFFIATLPGWAQQGNVSKTANSPWVNAGGANFSGITVAVNNTSDWTPFLSSNTAGNAIDNNLSNSAIGSVANNSSISIRISDNDVYSAGNYVGFDVNYSSILASVDFTINLYATGTATTPVQTATFPGRSNGNNLAMLATSDYQSIELVVTRTNSLASGAVNVNYAFHRAFESTSPSNFECNTPIALRNTTSTPPYLAVNPLRTYVEGVFGGVGNSSSGTENVIDNTLANSATLSVLVTGSASLSILKGGGALPSGYFAGFDIANSSLASASLGGGVEIVTYLGNQEQERKSALNGLVSASILSSTQVRIGFVTTKPFDEIQLIISSTGLNLGSTQVYNIVVEKFCEGPPLDCNVATTMIKDPTVPDEEKRFPLSINMERTGLRGTGVVGSFGNPNNVIDTDLSEGLDINITGGLGVNAGVSVIVAPASVPDYPAGTFVGFEIGSGTALSLNALSNMEIRTFKDNLPTTDVITTGNGLVSLNSVLVGGLVRNTIGFQSTADFDEVQFIVNRTASFDPLGAITVYGLIMKEYCKGPVLVCNTPTAVVTNMVDPNDNHPVDINSIRTGVDAALCAGCTLTNTERIIDADVNNFATLNLLGAVGASASISVKNGDAPYPVGTYAGFSIRQTDLLSFQLLQGITLTPYLNGVATAQGPQASGSGSLLAGSSDLLFGGLEGTQLVGFVATEPFDELVLTVSQPVGASLSQLYIHNFVVENLCAGPELVCNVDTKMVKDLNITIGEDRYPMVINAARTGTGGGVSITGIDDPNKAIDSNWGDPVEINLTAAVVGGYAQISIMDGVTDYPIGTFAGIEIANTSLLNAAAFENITLYTYLNGSATAQQTINSSSGLVSLNTSVIGDGRQVLGFIATAPFDEVQLVITQAVAGANLGITEVYGLILKKFCEGPELICNTPTPLRTGFSDPTLNHPVIINAQNTKITGGACVGCNITDTQAIIDNSTATAATINLLGSVLNTASVSVKNGFAPYPAGTYAGFSISGANLADISILDNIQLIPYLNGAAQPALNVGDAGFASASTDLLLGSPGTRLVGFISSTPFDELQLVYTKPVSVELAEIKIHDFVVQQFCAKTDIECKTTYQITSPDFPVVINSPNTGIVGAICAECAIYNEGNLVRKYNPATPNAFSTANITLAAGFINTGSISIKSGAGKFPANSFGGFVIQNANGLFELSLLNSITVTAYNNGTSVGSASGNSLFGFSLVLNLLGTSTSQETIGFKPTVEYDELQISISSLGDVGLSINVLGAILDTQGATIEGEVCESLPVTLTNFSATREGNNAVIQWQTTEEVNSDRFELMRSSDAKNWMTIATLSGQRNSTSLQSYQHVDGSPSQGTNYYRLKMIDLDGTFEMSPLLSLQFSNIAGVTLSPNPVVNTLQIKGVSDAEVQRIELRSITGQLIEQSTVIREMNMQHLPTGMYIISITKKDGSVSAYKIIKR